MKDAVTMVDALEAVEAVGAVQSPVGFVRNAVKDPAHARMQETCDEGLI